MERCTRCGKEINEGFGTCSGCGAYKGKPNLDRFCGGRIFLGVFLVVAMMFLAKHPAYHEWWVAGNVAIVGIFIWVRRDTMRLNNTFIWRRRNG